MHGSSKVIHASLAAPESASSAILDVLETAGVDRVFGVPGGAIAPLYDALLDRGIAVTHCQHETMAVYMAGGYARARGVPGVVFTTSGPGLLNALTGIAAALEDEVPIVLISGEVATTSAARGALQDGGSMGLRMDDVLRPLVKMVEAPCNGRRGPIAVQQALHIAMQRPHGPAFVRLPLDAGREAGKFSGHRRPTMALPAADDDTAAEIADAIAKATHPVLFVGVGSRGERASRAILALAEFLAVPVISDLEGRGAIPDSHPLYLGTFGIGGWGAAPKWLQKADLLINIGARMSDLTTNGHGELLGPNGRMIQLDHDNKRLGRAYDADLAILCDIPKTLDRIRHFSPIPEGFDKLDRSDDIRTTKRTWSRQPAPPMNGGSHHPRTVIRELQAAFSKNTLFTSDIGKHLLFASEELRIEHHDAFFASIGFGGMGSGIGTAMGLALAHNGSRPVVSICGDGGTLMVGNELATCVQHQIPVVLAIFKDGRLGMVDDGMKAIFGRSEGYELPSTDFVGWARSLGARAMHVQSAKDFERAAASWKQGPLLLEIPIDPHIYASNSRAAVINFSSGPQ